MNDWSARTVRRLLGDGSLVRLAVFAVLVLVAFSLAAPNYLSVINFQSMGFQVAEVGLLSIAVMISMLTGGIDLSVVSIAALSAITSAQLFVAVDAESAAPGTAALYTVLGIVASLVVGVLCGVLNGLLITRLNITPILATLGTMQFLNGLAIVWTGGKAIYGFPDQFLNLGTGYVAQVPLPVIVLIVVAVLAGIFVNRTGVGLRLKLVGANPTAARYSGLDNNRVLMKTYVASGLISAVAGIVIAARSASANADYGASYILLSIVIVVLGGVNPMGGFGTVTGVVLAAFVLQMVSSGFNMVGWNNFAYQIAQGVILIVVMAINAFSDRWRLTSLVAWTTRWRGGGGAAPEEVTEVPAGLSPAVPPSVETTSHKSGSGSES